jgi:uncharacterized protein YegJ (DUF2314 family)
LQKPKGDTSASIVILLRNPKRLDVQLLAHLIGKVTGRSVRAIDPGDKPVAGDNQPAGDMVAGTSPHFIAQVGGTAFAIHNLPAPYMNDPVRESESFPELRLRKAIKDHKAWLSMDILYPKAATPEAYRLAARVLANLIDEDCLALYHPPLNRLAPCSMEETAARLRTDDPIKAVFREITEIPVIPADDDPRLRAAEAEAQRRFPEFEAAFRDRKGTRFAVKTRLTRLGNAEHIWVNVDNMSAGKIAGTLGNDPVDLGDLKMGSRVEVEIGQVEDWIFLRDGAPMGAFTVPVLQQIEREESKGK